jgi:hypothetical protein
MFHVLEGKREPLAALRVFYTRVVRCFLLTIVIIAFSLLIGTVGYRYLGGLDWIDALHNAAMILTGMGPVNPMTTTSGKLFAVFYCLYSGITFLSLVAIISAPIYHRFLHRFHLDSDDPPSTLQSEASHAK